MATFSNMNEGFYDDPTSRSPRGYRSQQPPLNRANSRPMDSAYGSMQGTMYANNNSFSNNHAGQPLRFSNGPFTPPIQNGMQNGPMGNIQFAFDSSAAQTWNAGSSGLPNFSNGLLQDPSRSVRPSRGRMGLSNLWDDASYPPQQPNSQLGRQPSLTSRQEQDDDELIPTAIVIKNIPFAVKKEQLVELMVNMNLPLPYAFNYHFDNGVFRGLAFANFTSPTETEQVIQALNHMELSGRKLRVEYKKMLPLAERERIEREKRERRGQLEEQHRPLPSNQLHTQVSLSALSQSRNTPSPLSHRQALRQAADVDMNDPVTLEYYTQLTIFKNSNDQETLIFPQDIPPEHRRMIHTLAHHMGLLHTSHGSGEQRQVHVQRAAPGSNVSPPNPTSHARQGLIRTSTTDYSDSRPYDGPHFAQLRGQASVGLLDVGDNNAFSRQDNSNLRNAKSFADLRSWSPSPAQSSSSFPAALQTNGARLQAMADTAGSNTPTLTPVASNSAMGSGRDEPFLISTFNSMSLSNGTNSQTSPRRQRGTFFNSNSTWGDDQSSYQTTAPIGSKRTVSIGAENTAPLRQSRGPNSNASMGFRRHNGRGSDEMRTATSAIAE